MNVLRFTQELVRQHGNCDNAAIELKLNVDDTTYRCKDCPVGKNKNKGICNRDVAYYIAKKYVYDHTVGKLKALQDL